MFKLKIRCVVYQNFRFKNLNDQFKNFISNPFAFKDRDDLNDHDYER